MCGAADMRGNVTLKSEPYAGHLDGVSAGHRDLPQGCSWRRLSRPRNRVEEGDRKEEVDFAERTEHIEVACLCPSLQQDTHLRVKGLGLARLCLVV